MMRVQWILCVLILSFGAGPSAESSAQVVSRPVMAPIDHPIVIAGPVRTSGHWRKGIEQFGESLASGSLRLRGYQVLDSKLAGNHGIDLVAIKRDQSGSLADFRLIEVKSHYGKGKPRLGRTRSGTQMSRDWLAQRLCSLQSSGHHGRKLASDILRFHRSKGVPLERLGELHDVNLRLGKYTIRNPLSMTERTRPISIPRKLDQIARRSTQPASRAWATRHLSRFDQLRSTRMTGWLGASASSRALGRTSYTKIALLQQRQALRGAARGLARAAARAAIVVSVFIDAYEIYGHVRDYRVGRISRREFTVAMARSGTGIAAAYPGAWGGALAGAWVGGFGGPVAWATVPVGAVLGGAIGGTAGYFAGSYAGGFVSEAFYEAIDRDVQQRVECWLIQSPTPLSN